MTKKQKRWFIGIGGAGLAAAGGAAVAFAKRNPAKAYEGFKETAGALNALGPIARSLPKTAARGMRRSRVLSEANRMLWKGTGMRIIPKESVSDIKWAEAMAVAKAHPKPQFRIPDMSTKKAPPPLVNIRHYGGRFGGNPTGLSSYAAQGGPTGRGGRAMTAGAAESKMERELNNMKIARSDAQIVKGESIKQRHILTEQRKAVVKWWRGGYKKAKVQ